MALHYPVDPRMAASDVRGATVAYPNASNTAWLFRHADADWHTDHEYRLAAAVTAAFDVQAAALHKELMQAVVSLYTTQTAQGLLSAQSAQRTHDALLRFRADATAAILAEARGKHLGWYHQHPHQAHVHAPLERALAATVTAWGTPARAAEWADIRHAVEAVQAAVRTRHTYETRWDMERRLAAEGHDPVAGMEYCYCRLGSIIEFTEANSPDPAWAFDALRNGSIRRGGIDYTDAEVATNQFALYSVRWTRPVPAGTAPGADMGSVPWTASKPYSTTTAQ